MKVAKNNFAKLPEGSKWYVLTYQTPRNTLESLLEGPLTLHTRAVLPPLRFLELATVTQAAPATRTTSPAPEALTSVTVRRDPAGEAGYDITWMRDRDDLPVRVHRR